VDKPYEGSMEFEAQVRAALDVPGASDDFVAALRGRVLSQPRRPAPRLRLRPAWAIPAALLALLLILFLAIGPQRVLAAVRSLLGYVPGMGYVDTQTTLRVLDAPVSQERDGITLDVLEGLADAQQVILQFKVDGIRRDQYPDSEDAPFCAQGPVLRLPDGATLDTTGGEGNGWPSGYQTRVEFGALPAGVDQVTLWVPCLNDTRPGGAPENWEIPLRFVPAPPDFKPLPVLEVTTATPQALVTPQDTPTLAPQDPFGIQLSVDQMVELDDGYLFQGSISWQDALGSSLEPGSIELRDASGQLIPVETAEPDHYSDPLTEQRYTWAVRTAAKGYPGPYQASLPRVPVRNASQAGFELDLGPDPQSGQTWTLDQDVDLDGRVVRVLTAAFKARIDGSYELYFELQADPQQVYTLALNDPDNQSLRIGSGGGSDGQGRIYQSIYYDYRPTGVRRLDVSQYTYLLAGPWTATIELPAGAEAYPSPTPGPVACLNDAVLQSQLSTGLPEGLGGRLLVEGPALPDKTFPTLYVMNLDGSQAVQVGPGGWGRLSPDGSQVVYTYNDGMHLYDLASGQDQLLSWAPPDTSYSPIWSPDGEWIAFMDSARGIALAHPDGSQLHIVNGSNISTLLIGWMPDGQRLAISNLGAEGSRVQTLDINNGAVESYLVIDSRKGGFGALSPDGQRVAYSEPLFGKLAYGVYAANLDGSGKRLLADPGEIFFAGQAWSPDGAWLLVNGIQQGYQDSVTTTYLVQPDTCQVVYLENITGSVADWVAGQP
jgi:WD40 repeat protein